MRVAIMQPYFFPYIGYFQLISAVDKFIIYDNIQYTKKGWINRNRMLQNGKDVMFSLPLKKDSDYLDVVEREISSDFKRVKLLNQIKGAYHRAPYFAQVFPLIKEIVENEDNNLFRYLQSSIMKACEYMGIETEIVVSSDIKVNHELKNQDKVIALCEAVDADIYVNAIGGKELYSQEDFRDKGINLKFIQSKSLEYHQFDKEFVPWLSIIDVMMFNSIDVTKECLNTGFELVEGE